MKSMHYILASLALLPNIANAWTVAKCQHPEDSKRPAYTLSLDGVSVKTSVTNYTPKLVTTVFVESLTNENSKMFFKTGCYIKLGEEFYTSPIVATGDGNVREEYKGTFYDEADPSKLYFAHPDKFQDKYLNALGKFTLDVDVEEGIIRLTFKNDEPLTNAIERVKSEVIEAVKKGKSW